MKASCSAFAGSGGLRRVLIGSSRWVPGFRCQPYPGSRPHGQKRVCTMCTPLAPDRPVQPSDWPGFRMFPLLSSVCKAWKSRSSSTSGTT